METHMKLRSQTTTELKDGAADFVSKASTARRLPAHRAPTHPGEMLLGEFLKPLDITQSEFARCLGVSFQRLNEIIRGKRGITPDTALRLERVLGMSADFWMRLQLDWDLWHAMRGKNAEEIRRLVPIQRKAGAGPACSKKVS